MRTRILTADITTGAVLEGNQLDPTALERFRMTITCHECYAPIESLAVARVIFRADRAWGERGTEPDVVHERCLDARLRSRYRLEHVRLVRIAPLADLLVPALEALGLVKARR